VKQTVVIAKPPVYDQCVRVFGAENIEGKPIIWSWGDRIYNPLGIDIPRELFAHEAVHGERQGRDHGSIQQWWLEYLADAAFRYEEERLAHRAEWHAHVKYGAGNNLTPIFNGIAARLASPLYGKLISVDDAKSALALGAIA